MRRGFGKLVVVALALGGCAAGGGGGTQSAPLSEAQVQSRYPAMSSVFIAKCDKDGDGLYTNAEMASVRGIYHQMYISD